MVTVNVLQRVFKILHNGKTASSYTIEKNDKQYLVSASHVFEGSTEVNQLHIFHDNQWKNINVNVVFNSHKTGDTIVFALPHDISPRHLVEYGTEGVIMGTWSHFLGFPLDLAGPGDDINNRFPIPFIKAALISSINGEQHGLNTLYLDGHNNRGFSGGPVVWSPDPAGKKPKIIGTISGYLGEYPTASATDEVVDMFEVNAGIIRAYWVKDIFDLLP